MKNSVNTICPSLSMNNSPSVPTLIGLVTVYNLSISPFNHLCYINHICTELGYESKIVKDELEILKKKGKCVRKYGNKFMPLSSSINNYTWRLYKNDGGYFIAIVINSQYDTNSVKDFVDQLYILINKHSNDLENEISYNFQESVAILIEEVNAATRREENKDDIVDAKRINEVNAIEIEKDNALPLVDYTKTKNNPCERTNRVKRLMTVKLIVAFAVSAAFVLAIIRKAMSKSDTLFDII